MKRNAIIGGIGFVGANIAEELIKSSEVYIVTRKSSIDKRPNITKRLKELGAEINILDRFDYKNLSKIDADNYIYTIGKLSGSLNAMMEAHANILGELIKVAKEKSSRIIYISSIASIGEIRDNTNKVIYEEDEHLKKDVFIQKTPYEISKAEGEKLLIKNKDDLKNKFVILRPSTVFGPYAYETQWKALYNLAKRNIKVKLGGENLVYSKDLARIVNISTDGKFDSKWIYVNWPEKIDLEKVSDYLCKYFGKKKCITIRLRGLIKLGYYLSPPSSSIKMIYRSIKDSYEFKSKYLDNFNFTSFDIAFNDFIEWVKKYGFNP